MLTRSAKGEKVKDFEFQNNKGIWYSMHIQTCKLGTGTSVCIVTFININHLKRALFDLEIAKKDFQTLISLYEYRVVQRTRKLEEEIAERKRIEKEIKNNENLYRTILENYPNGSITLYDRDLRVLITEGGSFKTEGISKYDYLGKTIFEFMSPELSSHLKKVYSAVFKGYTRNTEILIGKKHYAITAVPVKDERKKIFACLSFARNITHLKHTEHLRQQVNEKLKMEIAERKSVEASLRVLSRHLVRAQESERLRLSHELHDGINQLLSAVKLKLHSAEDNTEAGDKSRAIADINNAKNYLERVIMEVRSLSKNLRPIPLEDTGINSALETLCNEFQERAKIQVTCTFEQIPGRFSSEIELTIYRIVQEAIHNIEKHAQAKNVNVNMNVTGGKIHLEIIDDGKGFDKEFLSAWKKRYSKQARMGLIGMRERVEFVKGKLNIESTRGRGTKITIEIPVVYREDK